MQALDIDVDKTPNHSCLNLFNFIIVALEIRERLPKMRSIVW